MMTVWPGHPTAAAAEPADSMGKAIVALSEIDLEALRRAVEDLTASFPSSYPNGPEYLRRLDHFTGQMPRLRRDLTNGYPSAIEEVRELVRLRREALLANPLLDFDRLIVVRRDVASPALGLPTNWQGNCALPPTGYDNDIAILSPVDPSGQLTTVFKPQAKQFIGDVDLHFDADRMLFSMPSSLGRWQIWEIRTDGSGLRQVTPDTEPDVDNYDACYLPDGRILFTSTAPMHGVPCVNGSSAVANLFRINADGSGMRQLCFDQDHNWCPTLLNGGRILYTRWEYTDTPHSNTRLLFHMNPDGTGQMAYYGSNSYWPTSIMYARAIPGHPTKVAAIVTGHHGVRRMGELVILDPARGRREADGVVQRIPGHNQAVEPIVRDNLVDESWPRFLHPFPLSEKYFLVSCQPTRDALWGVYLVDVFDNMLLLKEQPGFALLEPIPLRPTPQPPVIPDRIDLNRNDAVVYISDIYAGDGLAGVPRGEVKALRLFTYVYGYRKMGGLLGTIGMDGPWDIKRVLGTVPVASDGSAMFRIPANTPISLQPLDKEGKALQLMRSWMTAMPGETVSCAGCHEAQSMSPSVKRTIASRETPSEIEPWYGLTRGFAFHREVQPVLDRYCTGCHNGQPPPSGQTIPDFRGGRPLTDYTSAFPGRGGEYGGRFSTSYAELHRYVRRPGIESDYHLLAPLDFHADTTELVQILRKGHHGVILDAEAWDRLITWIDLNTPYHGTWTEIVGEETVEPIANRSRELRKRYAGVDIDYEIIPAAFVPEPAPVIPCPPEQMPIEPVACSDWPFDAAEAQRRQTAADSRERTIELGNGVRLDLVLVPAGQFIMGDTAGHQDERPPTVVKIDRPFWIGKYEVTNEQFAAFDPDHDSGVESMHSYQFGMRGYPLDRPLQPVIRVSWEQSLTFCRWLSERAGTPFTLPTEAQWEYACRAGTDTPFFYGDLDSDFAPFANLGDAKLRDFARNTYVEMSLLPNPNKYDDWIPKDDRFNDGGFISTDVGEYRPNAWGLHDMHGNVWEWTRTILEPYPYNENDGRNQLDRPGRRVVRGGSWYDRPQRARSAFRLAYRTYQRVFNVGFRVVSPAD